MLITIDTSGHATIAAYCLKTDSWYDYLAFKLDAKQAEEKGEFRKNNRYLRASLICLFSHLEGFVNDVESLRKIPAIHRGRNLWFRTLNITDEAKKVGEYLI